MFSRTFRVLYAIRHEKGETFLFCDEATTEDTLDVISFVLLISAF